MSITSLADLLPAESVEMPVKHPTLGSVGLTLRLTGRDSAQFRAVAKKVAKRRLGKEQKIDIDEAEQEGAEITAACILGWDNVEVFGVYSHARAVELMLMPGLAWLRDQVDEFATERANFFRKPAVDTQVGSGGGDQAASA